MEKRTHGWHYSQWRAGDAPKGINDQPQKERSPGVWKPTEEQMAASPDFLIYIGGGRTNAEVESPNSTQAGVGRVGADNGWRSGRKS